MSSSQKAASAGQTWEQRWHPLREEWVIIASHRNERPWTGETITPDTNPVPNFSPDCYLCPGNARVKGHRNPQYDGIFVFDNDVPCVSENAPAELPVAPSFFRNRPATGKSRVVCYSPQHNITLAELPVGRIRDIFECWQHQYRELAAV